MKKRNLKTLLINKVLENRQDFSRIIDHFPFNLIYDKKVDEIGLKV